MFVWLLKCVYSSYIIGRPSGRTSPHSHTCSMINSVLLQTHSTLCAAALFCSRKAKLFLASFLLMQCCADHAINNTHKYIYIYTYSDFSIVILCFDSFVSVASVRSFTRFSSIDASHLCPFVIIQSINIYLNAL